MEYVSKKVRRIVVHAKNAQKSLCGYILNCLPTLNNARKNERLESGLQDNHGLIRKESEAADLLELRTARMWS